jgi:hypothetical protein
MNRSLIAVSATLALGLGLSGPASAADPHSSCQGLAVSSLAGQPAAVAQERQDAFAEAQDSGITPGALTSQFARSHPGSLEACFE